MTLKVAYVTVYNTLHNENDFVSQKMTLLIN